MRGKHDLHPSSFGVCQLFLLFALARGGRPDARWNWVFFIPIVFLYTYSVFFCAGENPTSDYTLITTFISLVPTASDFILLRNHQPELRKIGQKKATSEMTFTERFIWAASLLSTSRGIGWAHEPTPHIPARPTASRGKFIATQFLWIVFYYVISDVAFIFIRENQRFTAGGTSFAAIGWKWGMAGWVNIVSMFCIMSACYVITSIIAVATGLHEPRDWPHLFGSPLDAYTVRKCWGRVWHQMHRRTFTSNSNFLANVLHLPRGTVMTYFKLFTSFFISGLIHAAADYNLHQSFSESKAIQFFVLQAVAITFEDALIAIASRLECKESKGFKLIGFIWVFAWFAYSAPMYFNHQAQAQGTVEETNNFSLIRMLTSFCVAKLKN